MGELLIIEDDPNVASSIATIAQSRGMTVTIIASAAEAHRSIARQWRAVVIDDRIGLDALEAARGTFTGAALVLARGESAEVANRAFDLRAKYLVKPVASARITMFLREASDDALGRALARWRVAHDLSAAELHLLELTVRGMTHDQIALERHVSVDTIRSQVRSLLRKTGDSGLLRAALRLACERR